MSSNIGGDRVLKVCDLCGGVDDHPRHIGGQAGGGSPDIVAPPTQELVDKVLDAAPKSDRARLLADLQNTGVTEHHYDCGRDAGCDVCRVLAADADGTGEAMLAHVTAKQAAFNDPNVVWAEAQQ